MGSRVAQALIPDKRSATKAFAGWALNLRDHEGNSTIIQPRMNRMVLFPGGLEHEILVSCPSPPRV